jgi:hypothetical protein
MTRAARGVALPYPETEENVVPNAGELSVEG